MLDSPTSYLIIMQQIDSKPLLEARMTQFNDEFANPKSKMSGAAYYINLQASQFFFSSPEVYKSMSLALIKKIPPFWSFIDGKIIKDRSLQNKFCNYWIPEKMFWIDSVSQFVN